MEIVRSSRKRPPKEASRLEALAGKLARIACQLAYHDEIDEDPSWSYSEEYPAPKRGVEFALANVKDIVDDIDEAQTIACQLPDHAKIREARALLGLASCVHTAYQTAQFFNGKGRKKDAVAFLKKGVLDAKRKCKRELDILVEHLGPIPKLLHVSRRCRQIADG
jgi:hypothetical protein